VELLKPKALCWLSKKVAYPVSQLLARAWGRPDGFPFGTLTSLRIVGQKVPCIATSWPGRGHERQTAMHVRRLLEASQV